MAGFEDDERQPGDPDGEIETGDPVPTAGPADGGGLDWWSLIRIPVLLGVGVLVIFGAVGVGAVVPEFLGLEPGSTAAEYVIGGVVLAGFGLLFLLATHASYGRNVLAKLTLGSVDVEILEVVPDDDRIRFSVHVPGAERADTAWIRVAVRGVAVEDVGIPEGVGRRSSRRRQAAAASAMSEVQHVSEGAKRWWEHNTGDVEVVCGGSEIRELDEQSRQDTEFVFELGSEELFEVEGVDLEVIVEIGVPLWPNWRSAVSIES